MERPTNKAPAPGGDSALRLRGVHMRFRDGWGRRGPAVLRGVDLDLAAGSSTGLAGPNGSGKSTVLRLAAGLEVPTEGTVEALGARPADAGVRSRIGYLGEESPYPRELGAHAALDLLAALAGMRRSDRRQRVPAALERVGLAGESRKRLARFSRGMLRRFGLAQAFLHEPDLVLLDEPTAGLDAPGYPVLFSLIDEACARGACVLLASHLLSDLAQACDRLVVLADGRLAAAGLPGEVAPDGLGELYRRLGAPGPQRTDRVR